MTDDTHEAFIHYWEAVDDWLLKLFSIHSGDAGIEPCTIAAAQEAGETPQAFALRFGEKYALITVAEMRADWGTP